MQILKTLRTAFALAALASLSLAAQPGAAQSPTLDCPHMIGGQSDNFDLSNQGVDCLDGAINDPITIAITGNYTLDETNGDFQGGQITFTGSLSGDADITVPADLDFVRAFVNGTTGGFDTVIKYAAGNTVSLSPGAGGVLVGDSTNVAQLAPLDLEALAEAGSVDAANDKFLMQDDTDGLLYFVLGDDLPGSGGGGASIAAFGTDATAGVTMGLAGSHSVTTSLVNIPWDTVIDEWLFDGRRFWLGDDVNVTMSDSTDRVTENAHGFAECDGPLQFTTSGSFPSPVAAATNYWANSVTTNDYRLSTTSTNCLADTFVDMTTAGSGTHTKDTAAYLVAPIGVDSIRLEMAFNANQDTRAFIRINDVSTPQGCSDGQNAAGSGVNGSCATGCFRVLESERFSLDIQADASATTGANNTFLALQVCEPIGSKFKATAQTTDATQATMVSVALVADSAHSIEALVQGREDATGDSYTAHIIAQARNEAGTSAAPTPNVTEVTDAGASTWDATIDADDTADTWRLRVTGEAAHTIDWAVTYEYFIQSGP